MGIKSLVFFPRGELRSSEICCKDRNLKSCWTAGVDTQILRTKEDINIIDIHLKFNSTIFPNGFVYKNAKGDEAVITYNVDTGNMFGSLKTHQDKSYAIEKCHNGYVLKAFDVGSFGQDIVQRISQSEIIVKNRLLC